MFDPLSTTATESKRMILFPMMKPITIDDSYYSNFLTARLGDAKV